MRRAGHADDTKRTARHVGGDGERFAHPDRRDGNAVDDRTGRQRARAGVEVWGIPDLHVEVVGGAGAAETAAAVAHGAVVEQKGNRVVIAGNGCLSHLGESVGGRIEELGGVLRRGIGEGYSRDLTAGDEDGAVREDDRVGEGSSVSHGADGLDRGRRGRLADRDDVGVARRVGVLVIW